MDTVIIHTLGAAYVKKDIYFLAYDPEQILWLEAEPDQIRNCVSLIRDYCSQRAVQEDYRLVILADLDPYANSQFKDHRDRLQDLLRYWYVKELLAPLDKESLLPESVAVIFLSTENKDNATSPVTKYTEIFDIRQNGELSTVTLPYEGRNGQPGGLLDYTPYLGTLVTYVAEAAAAAAPGRNPSEEEAQPALRKRPQRLVPIVYDTPPEEEIPSYGTTQDLTSDRIEQEIDANRVYSPIRKFGENLKILSIPYESTLTSPCGIFADLQINLAKLIALYEEDPRKVTEESIRPNDRDTLAQILANASAALQKGRSAEGQAPIYYALSQEGIRLDGADGLYTEMKDELLEKVRHLPGVTDALDRSREPAEAAAPPDGELSAGDTLLGMTRRKLHMGWLRIGSIKREFSLVYKTIGEQYDPETVYRDQQKILSICASRYARWRTEKRQVTPPDHSLPTEKYRPSMPPESFEELKAARDSCAKGVLDQIQDYSDVRKEAARLHTDFRKATHFWSPEGLNGNNKHFRRFSLIMGILFVFLAILPFFLITSQAKDLQISRTVVFVLTALAFAFLYSIGVIIWLNSVARTLQDLVFELKQLLYESQKLRAESICNILEVYSSQLPACLLKQAAYDRMAVFDRKNRESTRKYEEHMYIMSNALHEIEEVRTSLRLSLPEPADRKIKSPNYLLPPYDPGNKKFYMLFERGNK